MLGTTAWLIVVLFIFAYILHRKRIYIYITSIVPLNASPAHFSFNQIFVSLSLASL